MKAYTIHVTGIVQGIGFRPFVSKLAHELELVGTVRNDTSGVEIHIQGADEDCQMFVDRLQTDLPVHGITELRLIYDHPIRRSERQCFHWGRYGALRGVFARYTRA